MRRVLVQTDIIDPLSGEPLCVYAQVRSRWYWAYRRMRLFLCILWRRPDEQCTRIAWRTAWSVARGVHEDALTPAKLRLYRPEGTNP